MKKTLPPKKEARKKRSEIDITSEIISPEPDELKIKEFKWTDKQLGLIETLLDKKTKIMFIKGPAGTSKSLTAVYVMLRLLKEKKINEAVYIRSCVDSSAKGIGFLPGSLEDKVSPFAAPLLQKLDELLPMKQASDLVGSGKVKAISNQFLRGIQWHSYVVVDEAQGFEKFELTTIMTRYAEGAKMIFIGDPQQSDIRKSGFLDFYNLFDNEESRQRGIHTFEFDKGDILRAKILSFICDRIEQLK